MATVGRKNSYFTGRKLEQTSAVIGCPQFAIYLQTLTSSPSSSETVKTGNREHLLSK